MLPKFNTYEKAISYLTKNRTIPKELRFLMMNSMRSVFLTFFDKVFERASDITIPSLGNKERVEDVEKQNDEYMIKKAMMKDADFEDIKKSEIQYLQSKYGNVIPDLTSFLNKNVLSGIHLRHKVAMLMHKSLRDPKLKMTVFLKSLMLIEHDINKYLVPEGSVYSYLGSLFKFSFYNKTEKIHFFIKMEQVQEQNLGRYEVISFQSSYLDCLSRIMKEKGKCYLGFDALHFHNEGFRIQMTNFKEHLGELGVPYDSNMALKTVDSSMWSCMSSKVPREEGSSRKSATEELESEIMEVSDSDDESKNEANSMDNFGYKPVDEVTLLSFYHFCEKPTGESNKGNFVKRIRNMILFRNKNTNKDVSDEAQIEQNKKGSIH